MLTLLTFKENNKALAMSNDNFLEKLNDRVIIASYLLSPLSKTNNLENTSQLNLVKGSSSNKVNNLLIHSTIQYQLLYKTNC